MSIMVKEILAMAESALKEADCMDPKLDAERLFQYQYNLDNTGLFLMKPKMLDQKEAEKYFELVDFRLAGMPLQYITGSQEFMGLPFKVNENVLIPRQDTETLVETALDYMKRADVGQDQEMDSGNDNEEYLGQTQDLRQGQTPNLVQTQRQNEGQNKAGVHADKIKKSKKSKPKHRGEWKVLDLCCGSGAIGISLIHYSVEAGKKIKVTASDVSQKAISIAIDNAAKLKVEKQMDFVNGDLFQPFKKRFSKPKFDLIVTNPPYIKSQMIPTLQREVKEHEPMLALDGGEDGLDFYKIIMLEAKDYLEKDGVLMMEIGHDQGVDIAEIFDRNENYSKFKVVKDLAGHDRVAVLTY
ncbi:MAG TPA: HemK/PrmC family methyltransferase [Anaerovoracaceae bacterium]|nr:HemK/PrmC family methyltransferase [Anaerovoracaceae bacterium]